MKLFLSSYRAGQCTDSFLKLIGSSRRIAVINNAKDYRSSAERDVSVSDLFTFLESIRLEPEDIDLRDYFNDSEALQKKLSEFEVLLLAGGNTFVLRNALERSGGMQVIKDLVMSEKLLYAGESAGAILAGPTLHGVEYGDDPQADPFGYDKQIIWDGFGFTQTVPVPHYASSFEGVEEMIDELKQRKYEYNTITDDQALLVVNNSIEYAP